MHGFLKFFAFNVVNFSRSVWIGISDELFGEISNSEVELFGVISNSEVELFGKNDGQSGFIGPCVCNTGSMTGSVGKHSEKFSNELLVWI